MTDILLIGNPNCGKTTLFNALTGDNQRVGNWPGVTVEKKTGHVDYNNQRSEITDLPGIYSLVAHNSGLSQDELITTQSIVTMPYDAIINVIDACHLERHLYLTSHILELGKPVIIALNMMDIAQQRGISIDVKALEVQLGCPVIPIQAHKNIGIPALKHALEHVHPIATPLILNLPEFVQTELNTLKQELIDKGLSHTLAYYYSHRLAEGGRVGLLQENSSVEWKHYDSSSNDLDVILADARYQKIHDIVSSIQRKRSDAREHVTAKLDKIVLHRFWAVPIFLTIMYVMFLFAINIGGAFQDFFDISTDTIFVKGSAWLLQQCNAPNWIIAIIANGIGKGINTTLTFIPVIAAMFFFLSFLETSGYMARAAFVVDKVMRAMGLPGKSFIPMIVGFGCNVPAILAARTLDSERDRLLTVMMSPFMSCSARLAIYAIFVAAFFPVGGQNIVFSLYLIGILMAVFTGFIMRKTLLKGQASPLILELPAYHRPTLRRLIKEMVYRLRFFVLRAGKLIIPVCVILGALNAIIPGGGINSGEASTQSLLSLMAQWITPAFAPMGIHQDNWPATVGLLTGMLAKEVVVGTLNSLYAQYGYIGDMITAHFDFWGSLKDALWSIPQNLSHMGSALMNPIAASTDEAQMTQSVYGVMFEHFDGKIGAYAYLLFVLLYIPCVSTMAVIRQEANKRWMWLSIIWSLFIAYTVSVAFYQGAKFLEHQQAGFLWIFSLLFIVSSMILLVYYCRSFRRRQHATTNS